MLHMTAMDGGGVERTREVLTALVAGDRERLVLFILE